MISIKLLCNFTEITLRPGCSPVNMLHIFRAPLDRSFCSINIAWKMREWKMFEFLFSSKKIRAARWDLIFSLNYQIIVLLLHVMLHTILWLYAFFGNFENLQLCIIFGYPFKTKQNYLIFSFSFFTQDIVLNYIKFNCSKITNRKKVTQTEL